MEGLYEIIKTLQWIKFQKFHYNKKLSQGFEFYHVHHICIK